jgi:hypothetical protein
MKVPNLRLEFKQISKLNLHTDDEQIQAIPTTSSSDWFVSCSRSTREQFGSDQASGCMAFIDSVVTAEFGYFCHLPVAFSKLAQICSSRHSRDDHFIFLWTYI